MQCCYTNVLSGGLATLQTISIITDNLYQYYNGDKSVKVHHGNSDTGDTRQ